MSDPNVDHNNLAILQFKKKYFVFINNANLF